MLEKEIGWYGRKSEKVEVIVVVGQMKIMSAPLTKYRISSREQAEIRQGYI